MIIAVDFDGTIVDHCYPEVGKPVPHAIEWMKKFQEAGAKIILWTMRDKKELHDAWWYMADSGVEPWGTNYNPEQKSWTDSPKVYANIYIDDAAFGCPMLANPRSGGRPYVDWNKVGPAVLQRIKES